MKSAIPVREAQDAGAEELKADIARTRAHMDERLSDLGRKLKPAAVAKRARVPLAIGAAAVSAFAIYRIVRALRKPSHAPSAGLKRFQVRSAGIFEYIQALRLLASVVRKGKPGVFIVRPRKN